MEKKENRIREIGDSGRCKKQRGTKVYSKNRNKPNKSKRPAPKVEVIVDDVDIKQQNQNGHIDIENENVSGPQTVAFSKMEDIK